MMSDDRSRPLVSLNEPEMNAMMFLTCSSVMVKGGGTKASSRCASRRMSASSMLANSNGPLYDPACSLVHENFGFSPLSLRVLFFWATRVSISAEHLSSCLRASSSVEVVGRVLGCFEGWGCQIVSLVHALKESPANHLCRTASAQRPSELPSSPSSFLLSFVLIPFRSSLSLDDPLMIS